MTAYTYIPSVESKAVADTVCHLVDGAMADRFAGAQK